MRTLFLTVLTLGFATATLAQTTLSPYKISLYQDAARITSKGVVIFDLQRAAVPLDFPVEAGSVDLSTNVGARIAWYRVSQDSLPEQVRVASWPDVLQANRDRLLTVVFEIGAEFDEVKGNVRFVNEEAGLMLLHGTDNEEYYIPLDQIRQVLVEGTSAYTYTRLVPKPVLQIGLDKDIQTVPLEMHSTARGLSWSAMCRVRIIGSNKARLQMQAVIDNQLANFRDVDLELNFGSLLGEGQAEDADPLQGGRVSLSKGDQLVLTVRDMEFEYEAAYHASAPWAGLQADGQVRTLAGENTLRLTLPSNAIHACRHYTIIDENNRHTANLPARMAGDGTVSLSMGAGDAIKVTLSETEVERSSKPVKIGQGTYTKVTVEGRINVKNLGQKFAQVEVSRELVGEMVDAAKGQPAPSPNADAQGALREYAKTVTWRQAVDKGQSKEIVFQYATFVPRP